MKSICWGITLCAICVTVSSLDAQPEIMLAESSPPAWTDRVALHAVAKGMIGHGERNTAVLNDSVAELDHFNVWIDALAVDDADVVDTISIIVEWDLYRSGRSMNEIGDAFIRVDGIAGQPALNMKLGRFQIPFGEEYLWFSGGAYDTPLGRGSVASPYGWDEGIQLFGMLVPDYGVSYVAHATDGDSERNGDGEGNGQVGLKLSAQPFDALYLRGSIMDMGESGTERTPAKTAFGWGGTHPRPVEGDTLDGMQAWEGDVRLSPLPGVSLWGAYGEISVEDGTSASNDRDLEYKIAQCILRPSELSNDAPDWMDKMYLATRFSEIASAQSDEGYFLIGLNTPASRGFDTESVSSWQFGVGYELHENAKLILEYDLYDYDLIAGAEGDTGDRSIFYLELIARY